MKSIFVATAPLTVQVHLGNPSMARIPELTIRTMPECEGGGWYMPTDQAEAIASAWNCRVVAEGATTPATGKPLLQVGWSLASGAPRDGSEFIAANPGFLPFSCQYWRGAFVSLDPEDGIVARTFELWRPLPGAPS